METEIIKRPKVGVGIIVIKDKKVLLGKRKGSHGAAKWALPGGHLEYMEEVEDCVRRELLEEAGIQVKDIKMATFTNDLMKDEDKHYATLFVVAKHYRGQPKIMEPHKCDSWGWYKWNDLPKPLFLPLKNLIDRGFNPFKRGKV